MALRRLLCGLQPAATAAAAARHQLSPAYFSSSGRSFTAAAATATAAAAGALILSQPPPQCEQQLPTNSPTSTAISSLAYQPKQKQPKALPFTQLTMYQYSTCPFCNKVRAFLDYYGVPYSVVEVNPLTKKEIKDWSSDYKKVPIVTLNNRSEKLIDSSEIIDTLYSRLAESNPKGIGKEKALKERKRNASSLEEEKEWRRWVDKRWVHVVTPNLYRTAKEAKQSFDYMTEHGNFTSYERETARYFGAAFMYGMSKYKLKPRHNITDERQAMYDEADKFVSALGNRSFMGGKEPNLADLSVFGIVRAIQGTDTFTDLMANTGMQPWFSRMEAAVGQSSECRECATQ